MTGCVILWVWVLAILGQGELRRPYNSAGRDLPLIVGRRYHLGQQTQTHGL